MRVYIQQHVFTFRDRFTVWDAEGNDLFFVYGDLLRLTRHLHAENPQGEEMITVDGLFMRLTPEYELSVKGAYVGKLIRHLTLLIPSYEVEGLDWQVEGDFFSHEYEITDARGCTVARLHKQWMTFGDSYELEVMDAANLLPALAVVLGIDCATAG